MRATFVLVVSRSGSSAQSPGGHHTSDDAIRATARQLLPERCCPHGAIAASSLPETHDHDAIVRDLMRIRPKNCALKDAFLGSSPLECNPGAVKIGHDRHFTRCGEAEQSETASQGGAVSRLEHYSIRTE